MGVMLYVVGKTEPRGAECGPIDFAIGGDDARGKDALQNLHHLYLDKLSPHPQAEQVLKFGA